MDKKIILQTDLFSHNQHIGILENNEINWVANVSATQIPEAVLSTCNKFGINDIYLCGDPTLLLQGYKDEILEYNKIEGVKTYGSLTKLNIEIEEK